MGKEIVKIKIEADCKISFTQIAQATRYVASKLITVFIGAFLALMNHSDQYR